jgi:hypothetical protein
MIHVHGSGDLTPEWICSKGGASASFDFIKMASGKHKKYKEFLVFVKPFIKFLISRITLL